MKIQVVINSNQSQTDRGNLLERLAKILLEAQDYSVETQLRNIGVEIDLLCKNNANPGKKIYVECKAYNESKKIDATIIRNLAGAQLIGQYPEAWLISTSDLGKDAKGLVESINSTEQVKLFTFYTPEKLVSALIASKTIQDSNIAREGLIKLTKDSNKLSAEVYLIVSTYGYFWAFEHLDGGLPAGVILAYANNSNVITDEKILTNISSTDTSLSNLDFKAVFDYVDIEPTTKSTVGINNVKLDKKYLLKINQMGIQLAHPDTDEVTLKDIFVYPDLQYIEDGERKTVRSNSIADLFTDPIKYLIFGDDNSGKSSLAHTLQQSLNSMDMVSIYVNAADIKNSEPSKFESLLLSKFKNQYSNQASFVEYFQSLLSSDRNKLVLLIDDFDLLAIKREPAKLKFYQSLRDNFKKIIIFANSSQELEMMARSEIKDMFTDSSKYTIKPLGHKLRDDLIDKWLNIEDREDILDGDFYNKKDDLSKKIKVAIGANFLPAYPLYLLIMLQMIEAGSSNKLQGSSYAELYGYLINKSLSDTNIAPDDFDLFHTYLSFVAYQLFQLRRKSFTTEELKDLYDVYAQKMDIDKSFEYVHSILVKAKILILDDENYAFIHSYSYYFFAAKYLSDNYENPETKALVESISEKTYRMEYANIILFLIHHSKNKSIIDKIMQESEKLFESTQPSLLSEDELSSINKLISQEVKVSLLEKSSADYRREKLAKQDELEDGLDTDDKATEEIGESEEDLTLFAKINLSFKLMEILGQISQNYYGSLDSANKVNILQNVQSLGLRTHRTLVDDMTKYLESIMDDIASVVEKKGLVAPEDKQKVASKVVFSFISAITMLFVKRISDSMASRNLLMSSDKVLAQNPSVASKLINIALKLNFANGFDPKAIIALNTEFDKNYLAQLMLQNLVIEYIYKFDLPYNEKQSICNKLGIEIREAPSEIIAS